MNNFATAIIDTLKEWLTTEEILNELDYADIVEYVAQVEQDKRDDDYDTNSNR